jgi:hypothetical protein
MIAISPTEQQIDTALVGFLASVLPGGTPVILGQLNRVPQPQPGNHVVLWPLRRDRLATNIDGWQDCYFDASISGTSMLVGTVAGLPLAPGRIVYGPGVAINTTIVSGPSGGGSGTYVVSPSQTVGDETMSAGAATFMQQTEVTYQLDVHAPTPQPASDMAQAITTMFRDTYATQYFAAQGFAVRPLVADQARQVPFINAEDQYESRYVIEARMQTNQTISGVPAQFADSAVLTVVDADVVPVVGGNSWSDGWSDGFGG